MPERENLFSTSKPLRGCNSDSRNDSPTPILPARNASRSDAGGHHSDVEPKMWKGMPVCCPEGTSDRSQAIYCLETRPVENPSCRARSDPYPGLINRRNRGAPIGPNHTVPTGRFPFSHRYQAINCLATFITSLVPSAANNFTLFKPPERAEL